MSEKYSNKVAYDLAMFYAKSRFEHDFKNGLIPKDFLSSSSSEQSIFKNEVYYLAFLFRNAYHEYTKGIGLKDLLDFVYEPWNPPDHVR